MKPEDIARMNGFFETHSYDQSASTNPTAATAEAAHDEEDGEAAGVAYITPAGEILLLLRSPDSATDPDQWGFPAGKMEEEETREECAAREFLEETQEDCPDLTSVSSCTFLNEDTGVLFTCFLVFGPKFTPRLDHEHTAFMWARADNLPSPIHPGVTMALSMLPEAKE